MLGVWINVIAVLAGGVLGLLLGSRVPGRLRDTVMQGLGLCVAVIGLLSALETADVLCMIICIVIGALLGEWIDIEKRLERLGERAQMLLIKGGESEDGTFVRGFMTASLVFCVGAMSVVGSLESGLSGNHATLTAKAMLDGVASVFFAAALGPGVLLSALAVLVYQGAIALCGGLVAPFLTDAAVLEMSAVGGVIILGIGLNMLGATKIRVGNLLPAVFLPLAYVPLASWIGGLF